MAQTLLQAIGPHRHTGKPISADLQVVSGCERMERTVPGCPDCGKKMTFYSSDALSEHYVCANCNQFLAIPRRVGFFRKSPFKPRYPLIHH